MSSTKRGGQRTPADAYPTPPWCVHRLLDRVTLPSGLWYEPCAGDGAIVQVVNSRLPNVAWALNELRSEMDETLRRLEPMAPVSVGDILDPETPLPPRDKTVCIITNPPYRIAWELLHKMLREFPNSYIVLLLRVNFIASKGRHGFMSQYMPDVYVLPNRPGFKAWGKTDSPEYGWFVWKPWPRARARGLIELLDLTSVEERKRVADAATVYSESGR